MRSVVVHIPRGIVDSVAAQLDGCAVDFDAMAASLSAGDPMIEETVLALGGTGGGDDLYAEAAAALLTVHLLTRHTRALILDLWWLSAADAI
ncbi:hypothetical protein ABZ942_38385 [Nocardia sp. NPDC046473]|uniref:hypothetical protein n=1 Tax=Nocardia sp. NPDC046473 TaxID=3155733 RepID=UPI0033CDC763